MNCEVNMSLKDSSIMLFGKKIPVPEYDIPVSSQMGCEIPTNSTTMNACSNSKQTEVEMPHTQNIEKSKNSSNKENESKVNTSNEDETKENSSTGQDKVLKKPDKILQCPRCNNFDTKFCYFNNYNVNQPRHFCRNCHRYWTAGGSMRNVPVGAGRRKNKQVTTSQYRNTDGIPAANLEINYTTRYQHFLKFGQEDTSLHESNNTMINRINQKKNVDESAKNCRENGDEESSLCLSSVTNGYTQGNELSESEHKRSKPLQCHPASSWMIPLNKSWNNVSSKVQSSMQMCSNPYGIDPSAMQWCHTPMVAVTNIFTPNIPLQFVHGSYWNGTPSIGSIGCISPSSSTTSNI